MSVSRSSNERGLNRYPKKIYSRDKSIESVKKKLARARHEDPRGQSNLEEAILEIVPYDLSEGHLQPILAQETGLKVERHQIQG
jgi:hypothetical protein